MREECNTRQAAFAVCDMRLKQDAGLEDNSDAGIKAFCLLRYNRISYCLMIVADLSHPLNDVLNRRYLPSKAVADVRSRAAFWGKVTQARNDCGTIEKWWQTFSRICQSCDLQILFGREHSTLDRVYLKEMFCYITKAEEISFGNT